jgi:hypothetical protein
MTKADTTVETTARCDTSKVKVGSVFSRHSHGTVVSVRDGYYTLRNDGGFEWEIHGDNILENEFSFADQHDEEIRESRTRIIEIMNENGHTAMTVVYRKKPDPKHVAKELAKGKGKTSDRAWNKKVKDLVDGELRTMVGYHTNSFDSFDRLRFHEHGKGPRLVDPRTVELLIVARQKFVVK